MYKLVLLRHGESVWNRDNIFTGWVDVGLSPRGQEQSKEAGQLLQKEGFIFERAFTSVLSRATETLKLVLAEMGLEDIPQEQSWRLNERHYGALQGLNKKEAVARFGEEQVRIWRRSYSVKPPAFASPEPVRAKAGFADLKKNEPAAESLADVVGRAMPYWQERVMPAIQEGQRVLVVAHGSTLRAIIKELDQLSELKVESLEVPKAIPLVYELDEQLKPVKHYYLGDQAEVELAIRAIVEEIK